MHESENPNEEVNENDDEYEETLDKPDDEDHEMEGETFPEPDTAVTLSSSRGEKRTDTQENVFVKRRLMARPYIGSTSGSSETHTTEENGNE